MTERNAVGEELARTPGPSASRAPAAAPAPDVLERRYRGLIEHCPDAITIKNLAGRYLMSNARFCEWLGVSEAHVVGAVAADLITNADVVASTEAHEQQVIAEHAVVRFTQRFAGPGQPERLVDLLKFPIFDDDGALVAIGTIGRDVTEAVVHERDLAASEHRYRAFISDTSDAIWHLRFDPPIPTDLPPMEQAELIYERGVFAECNAMYAATYAYQSADQIVGRRYLDVVPPGNGTFLDFWARFAEQGYRFVARESAKVGLDGKCRHFVKNGHGVVENGFLVRAWGTERNVTEQRQAEQRLLESERRYRALYDDAPSMYFTLAADGAVRSVNSFGAEQLGYADAAELVDAAIDRLHLPEDVPVVLQSLRRCLEKPEGTHRWEVRKLRKDGTIVWVRETARAIRDDEDRPAILSVCEDTSEARELSRELSYQASHDPLTGLVNRREFERRLTRVIETARAEGTQHAVCYLDLDQFKVINDTCGHVAGDQLLRQVAAVMLDTVRKRDTFARLGGDEFGVLVEQCDLEAAERVARGLAAAVEGFRFAWEDKSFAVGVSIGLVPIDEACEGVSAALAAADSACYAAKEQGRNRIHVYREDDAELIRRHGEMQWVAGISSALEGGRLRLARQPIAQLSKVPSAGAHIEMLLRLEDEQGALVMPGAFLPAAERYNLCTRLDRWVLENTVRWMCRDPDRIGNMFLCSVNLSGQSLGDDAFLGFVLELLRTPGMSPDRLCLEVTETAAIANLAAASRFIATLRERGVRFALDDFGSGLSSFAYLKSLPVDYLKIDGLFVKDIVDDPIDKAMVRSINEIGHVMGVRTIAEFVENEAILRLLREIGVDYAQGFGVGRPALIDHRA